MAVLPDAERKDAWAKWMRGNREEISVLKADLRDAVNAIDDWVDANAASFNSAIPLPARTALTSAQKARLLMLVVSKRFEVS